MKPNFVWALINLGWAHEQKGELGQAIRVLQEAAALSRGLAVSQSSLAHALAGAGRQDEAKQILAELYQRSQERYVPAYEIAMVHSGLGNSDEAFRWLDRACEERSGFVVHLKWDPRLDKLHRDPRFEKLLQRIGLPRG